MTEERRLQIRDEIPVSIILVKSAGANQYQGVVEHSFSMAISSERVNMFWSGVAVDNIVGAKHDVDGKKNAERCCKTMQARLLDFKLEVFDARSPDCPVEIDWEQWSKDMMIGLSRKFFARNAIFSMKG